MPAKKAVTPPRRKADPRDDDALALWAAGVSFDLIAVRLRFRNAEAAEDAAARALEKQSDPDPALVRRLEIHRLNVMQMALWPKAKKGDKAAVAQILEIQRQRIALGGPSGHESDSLLGAVNLTISCLEHIEPAGVDAAMCAAARKIGAHIDAATESGNFEVQQKAMFVLPHLMNVLREMKATPKARLAMVEQSETSSKRRGSGSVSTLAAFRNKQGAA